MLSRLLLKVIVCGLPFGVGYAQSVLVRAAAPVSYPVPIVDGNSPGVWVDGMLRVYTSTGDPLAMMGPNLFQLWQTESPEVLPRDDYPLWIESVWRDEDGTIYGWYHHEPGSVCSSAKLTAPKIGAVVSEDGGHTFRDLGIVLATGYAMNCKAANGFFAGGHGDFSVIADREHQYFYFLFGNYSGPVAEQGVVMARMAFADRRNPVGAVYKYHAGEWHEPGVGGRVTPIFPAVRSWEGSDTDAFWGPSVHWNKHLEAYVMVLNRSCSKSGWPQEGIYLSDNDDLSDPQGWRRPVKILDAKAIGFAPGYYPQVVGTEEGETDSLVGEKARLYVKGVSKWEIVFIREEETPAPPPGPPDDDDDVEPDLDPGAPRMVVLPRRGAGK